MATQIKQRVNKRRTQPEKIYRHIESSYIYAIYIKKRNALILTTNKEGKDGVIYFR